MCVCVCTEEKGVFVHPVCMDCHGRLLDAMYLHA